MNFRSWDALAAAVRHQTGFMQALCEPALCLLSYSSALKLHQVTMLSFGRSRLSLELGLVSFARVLWLPSEMTCLWFLYILIANLGF